MTVFQELRFPHPDICDVEELYFHRYDGEEEVLFDGYFNLFDIGTRKKYTTIKTLLLRLSVSRPTNMILMHNKEEIGDHELIAGENIIEFPYDSYDDGVFWFKLRDCGEPVDKCFPDYGIWEGECEDKPIRMAVVTCTYKREEALLANLNRLFSEYDNEQFFDIFVVDNGNTLKNNDSMVRLLAAYPTLHLVYNKNLGGAGGFTRGMLEVMNHLSGTGGSGFTHVLMMDDDAVFDPEIFTRIKGLISSLKAEYEGVFVGSALFRTDFPYIQQFSGEYLDGVFPRSYNSIKDMREYENCVSQISFESGKSLYSAWRFCCYPISILSDDNLPYPFFLHYDDAEYGTRDAESLCIFLNGIAVWHRVVDLAEPGIIRYYEARNMMIFSSIRDMHYKPINSVRYLCKKIMYLALEYRYDEAELIYNGFLDYFRGPSWLVKMDASERNQRLITWYRSRKKTTDAPGQVPSISFERIKDNYSEKKEKSKIDIMKLVTMNGIFFPQKQEDCVLTTLDSPFKAYRVKNVMLYDPTTGQGSIHNRDLRKTVRCIGMMITMVRYAIAGKDMPGQYREQFKYMTSKDFWIDYLGLNDRSGDIENGE